MAGTAAFERLMHELDALGVPRPAIIQVRARRRAGACWCSWACYWACWACPWVLVHVLVHADAGTGICWACGHCSWGCWCSLALLPRVLAAAHHSGLGGWSCWKRMSSSTQCDRLLREHPVSARLTGGLAGQMLPLLLRALVTLHPPTRSDPLGIDLTRALRVRTCRLRGTHATIRGPYQHTSDQVVMQPQAGASGEVLTKTVQPVDTSQTARLSFC